LDKDKVAFHDMPVRLEFAGAAGSSRAVNFLTALDADLYYRIKISQRSAVHYVSFLLGLRKCK